MAINEVISLVMDTIFSDHKWPLIQISRACHYLNILKMILEGHNYYGSRGIHCGIHTLCQFWCMGARHGPPQSTCSLALMHLTHGHYARSWGHRTLTMCQMQKLEEPLVVHRFLTWWLIDVCSWLIDVCSSSAILLAVHLARITTKPLQRLPTSTAQLEVKT